jgi:2-hydroxy-3-oxopropionate reductase
MSQTSSTQPANPAASNSQASGRPEQKPRIAFIGLGVMGHPMAAHRVRAGYTVTVFNRTAAKAQQWCDELAAELGEKFDGSAAATPALAAAQADVAIICVGRDEDVREVVGGKHGIVHCMTAGGVVIDHTTTSAELARELATQLRAQGLAFLDAPMSGGQAGAQRGQLSVMVGGAEQILQTVLPILNCYSRCVKYLGAAGSGQLAKMANQICIAGVVQGLAEALHFARNAELDIEALIEVISQGAAQSWQMQNRYKTMAAGEYHHGFAVDWMRKDLAYTLTEARRNGSQLPLTALVDQFYGEVQALGGGRWDTSSLLARLEAFRK